MQNLFISAPLYTYSRTRMHAGRRTKIFHRVYTKRQIQHMGNWLPKDNVYLGKKNEFVCANKSHYKLCVYIPLTCVQNTSTQSNNEIQFRYASKGIRINAWRPPAYAAAPNRTTSIASRNDGTCTERGKGFWFRAPIKYIIGTSLNEKRSCIYTRYICSLRVPPGIIKDIAGKRMRHQRNRILLIYSRFTTRVYMNVFLTIHICTYMHKINPLMLNQKNMLCASIIATANEYY